MSGVLEQKAVQKEEEREFGGMNGLWWLMRLRKNDTGQQLGLGERRAGHPNTFLM